MIGRLAPVPLTATAAAPATAGPPGRKVLRMVSGCRTAGAIPCWDRADKIGREETGLSGGNAAADPAPALDTPAPRTVATKPGEQFGFADLLDMINPLQNIPVVNTIYRKLTGDEMKPASKVIGGTIFGGAIGLAGSLVNLVVEHETGRDIAQNAFTLVTRGERPRFKSQDNSGEINYASGNAAPAQQLPGQVLAVADLSYKAKDAPDITIEKLSAAEPAQQYAPRRERQPVYNS